ncbi:MAG TPA: hypothetical protein DCS48_01315 [Desulfovibrio sp.]|nr:hypothetical protein [Desulfovibrio sp.]
MAGKVQPLLSVGDSGKRRKSAIRFHNAHGLLLDSLAEEADIQNSDRNFIEFREKLKTFQEIKATAPPEGLQGSLRSYQHESLCWFDFLKQFGFGGILADDMGLGKTIQVLSWLLLQKERKNKATALVVVPTSLIFNWEAEAERFCPQLKVLNYSGPGRKELETGFSEYDIILTTYGILRLDVEILKETKWDYLILDESQAIKNPDSQTAKAARILDADWKLCMTGTPLENKLDELWSQFNFINPGLLGFRKSFDDRFSKTIALGDEKQKELLQKLIRPFTLRRTKDQVTKDLPPKQESIIFCDMPPAQLKSYNKIRDHYRSEILAEVDQKGLGKSKMKVLEGLLRLRQAACHTALIGEKKSASGKLAELILNVQKIVAEGHKVLVFSQFTKFLKLIREEFESEGIEYEYLDGRTPLKTRKKRVTNFQSPDGPPVFCISLKAGGVGLNLTAADYVFIMDPWWNPAVESQAVDRTHRIGQTKNVFAYRFISTNSIDEKVVKLQDKKRDLAEILASGATSSVSKLTRKDLEELFS